MWQEKRKRFLNFNLDKHYLSECNTLSFSNGTTTRNTSIPVVATALSPPPAIALSSSKAKAKNSEYAIRHIVHAIPIAKRSLNFRLHRSRTTITNIEMLHVYFV